jgi:ribosome-binding factor A
VFVALASQDGEDSSTTIDGLVAARGFIRYELRERMGVRHVPELSFHIDTSDGIKGRIGDLLGRAEKNTKKLAAKHAAAKATAAQSAKEAQ